MQNLRRLKAQKQYGSDDGMTELAVLNEDSAWCTMQTRYLELRNNRDSMARAKSVLAKAEYAAKRTREKEENKKRWLTTDLCRL